MSSSEPTTRFHRASADHQPDRSGGATARLRLLENLLARPHESRIETPPPTPAPIRPGRSSLHTTFVSVMAGGGSALAGIAWNLGTIPSWHVMALCTLGAAWAWAWTRSQRCVGLDLAHGLSVVVLPVVLTMAVSALAQAVGASHQALVTTTCIASGCIGLATALIAMSLGLPRTDRTAWMFLLWLSTSISLLASALELRT